MSALHWQDWSCDVRVVLADGLPASTAPHREIAARAERTVRILMDRVASACSRFDHTSDLSRANARAGRPTPVSRLALDLVEVAIEAARSTEGACDPTIGRDLTAAGYDADIEVVRARTHPVGPERGPRRRPDWTAVRVDRSLRLLHVPPGLQLDLGATAKAWTADRAAQELLVAVGVPVLVSIGGDVAVAGIGQTWPVLVSELDDHPGEVVLLSRGGIATSSTLGRSWAGADGPRHHVIDPATGRSVESALRTVSVAADTCVQANSLSTAALVWGAAAPERLASVAARWVSATGTVGTTARWTDLTGEGIAA